MTLSIRHDWTTEEIQTLLELPLMELLWQAQTVHRKANPGYRVQLASLLSCLLYTSPSPRDKRQSRMPSSA